MLMEALEWNATSLQGTSALGTTRTTGQVTRATYDYDDILLHDRQHCFSKKHLG
jgi:hypothetical protein